MDLTLSPSEETFRDELRAWLEKNHPGEPPEDDARGVRVPPSLAAHAARGADGPGSRGRRSTAARGATLIEQAIFSEEMVRAKAPAPANILGLAMGGPVVITHGTDEQKQRWLEPILSARGDLVSGLLRARGRLRPRLAEDARGEEQRRVARHGQKVWTTYAHVAKWCMLVARTDPDAPKHQGLTYFIMDMEQEGVEVKPLVQITGESEFNEIFMEEARIPDENVIGEVGNGWAVAITTLMNERSGIAFASQAYLKIQLRKLIELAKSTSPNGSPAADNPNVRQRLAQLWIESEILRLSGYRGLTQIMKTGVPGPEGSLGKWQWSDANQALTELAMEIEGPYSQLQHDSPYDLDDTDWQYYFLRSRANSIEGGTTEILKNIVAERVLGLPKLR